MTPHSKQFWKAAGLTDMEYDALHSADVLLDELVGLGFGRSGNVILAVERVSDSILARAIRRREKEARERHRGD